MRAVLSVSDKTGIETLAGRLVALGVEIISTGGTLAALEAAGVHARSVSEITGVPEIMEGRVKTLHPAVHGGILARRSEQSDLEQLSEVGGEPIDVVVVNLYPFEAAIQAPDATLATALERIDVGGPAMLRAAAKNFQHVLVLTEPEDYGPALDEWESLGEVTFETRRRLAARAFSHVSAYDARIAAYLHGDDELFPDELTISVQKVQDLRYGENPHQRGALYRQAGAQGMGFVDHLRQIGGTELSFNNVLDAQVAVSTVMDFLGPTVVIVKHGIPCGLSTHNDLSRAFELALMGDQVSAFGGIVAVNREIDKELAENLVQNLFHLVVAPSISVEAQAVLSRKRNLRLLEVGEMAHGWDLPLSAATLDWKRLSGGFLLQTPDSVPPDEVHTRVVTSRQPTLDETTDLLFAWRAVEHVRSNAITLAKDLALVGVGAGQPSRVDSVKLAVEKAGMRAQDSVLASDAFFPFADGLEEAARAGVTAVIQPGGSIRDDEVIEAAERFGIAMVFTGTRHFRH